MALGNAMMQAAALAKSPDPANPPARQASNVRFRSFAERYVIERARHFKAGKEIEEAWEAMGQARTIYNMIKERGRTLNDDE